MRPRATSELEWCQSRMRYADPGAPIQGACRYRAPLRSGDPRVQAQSRAGPVASQLHSRHLIRGLPHSPSRKGRFASGRKRVGYENERHQYENGKSREEDVRPRLRLALLDATAALDLARPHALAVPAPGTGSSGPGPSGTR